jgi:hypothetical protein
VHPAPPSGRTTFATFVRESHLLAAHELPERISRHATELGFDDATTLVVDVQQQVLVPFLAPGAPEHDHERALPVASTMAGRAFQTSTVVSHDEGAGPVRLYVPLLDGTERIGVLILSHSPVGASRELSPVSRQDLDFFASLVAELLTTKTPFSDTLVRLRRTAPMSLSAEIQWALLPPLTFVNADVSVAAALEPAYEVAGDSVDYAVDADTAKFAVFDGMGHELHSAQMVALVVAAYRNARRHGRTLAETAAGIDQVVHEMFGGLSFVTGILAELDLATGRLAWVSAGHPPPLLLRHGRLVKSLEVTPLLPFGLGRTLGDTGPDAYTGSVGTEQLEPGDLLLLYTDGVTEARSPQGEMFGETRLTELVLKNVAAGLPPAETMRRAVTALMEHQGSDLADDATLLLASWRPEHLEQLLP